MRKVPSLDMYSGKYHALESYKVCNKGTSSYVDELVYKEAHSGTCWGCSIVIFLFIIIGSVHEDKLPATYTLANNQWYLNLKLYFLHSFHYCTHHYQLCQSIKPLIWTPSSSLIHRNCSGITSIWFFSSYSYFPQYNTKHMDSLLSAITK